MKRVFVFFADGFEQVEALTPVDYLRRAGAEVITVGVSGKIVTSSHKVPIMCDVEFSQLDFASNLPDCIILPGGGMGSKALSQSSALRELTSKMFEQGRCVAAICAAPAVVLASWKLLNGKKWTCFPGSEEGFEYIPVEDRVVIDGSLITSRAAGTAEEFTFAVIEYVCGKDAAEAVRKTILAR